MAHHDANGQPFESRPELRARHHVDLIEQQGPARRDSDHEQHRPERPLLAPADASHEDKILQAVGGRAARHSGDGVREDENRQIERGTRQEE